MAGTGVLPFIRGIDLTLNDLEAEKFPEAMEDMTSLRYNSTDYLENWLPWQLSQVVETEQHQTEDDPRRGGKAAAA